VIRTKVVLKDVGVGENGAKTWAAQKYSLTWPKVKLHNKRLWVGGLCWGKGMEVELVDKTCACKNTPHASFPSHLRKRLNQICVSLCLVTLPRGGKVRHYWGSRRSKCQPATLYGSCPSLSNGKKNATYITCNRIAGIWLYKWGRQKPKWKDPSNVET
jgi:hypothetical protein